jgi:glycerol uptake facilitator-like aquaporin
MRKALAEYLGTFILALAVVGSGVMATNLTSDVGLQLLINAGATAAILWLIINCFTDISGAHFNPVVTLIGRIRGDLSGTEFFQYVLAQIFGAISGTAIANLLFDLNLLEISHHSRDGWNLLLSEAVATAGLVFIIFQLQFQKKSKKIPAAVAGWIFAAYFFTSSTSFANPAITIGRIFTDTFSGIAPHSATIFIPVQIIGSLVGYFVATSLHTKVKTK